MVLKIPLYYPEPEIIARKPWTMKPKQSDIIHTLKKTL